MSEFEYVFTTEQLARGLRPSASMPRNSNYLYECEGCVGKNGVLQLIETMPTLDTSVISDGFPYPQLFAFKDSIIVCGKTTIYEYVNGSLIAKITVSPGVMWSGVDFFGFLYFTNGKEAVIRRATDKAWVNVTDTSPALGYPGQYPIASAACNFNGQVLVGGIGERT